MQKWEQHFGLKKKMKLVHVKKQRYSLIEMHSNREKDLLLAVTLQVPPTANTGPA